MKRIDELLSLIQLQQCLQYWEEFNFLGDLKFYICQKILPNHASLNNEENRINHGTLTGSELTGIFTLGRGIEGYKRLRSFLDTQQSFNPEQFLPRIPKSWRDKFSTKLDFIESIYQDISSVGRFLIPVYLEKWLKGKKICEISHPENIPLADPGKENYLAYLPYDNFILTLDKPLKKTYVDDNRQEAVHFGYYSTHVICREENILTMFSIPGDVKDVLLNEAQHDAVKEIYGLSKKTNSAKALRALNKLFVSNQCYNNLVSEFSLMKLDMSTGKLLVYDQNYSLGSIDLIETLRGLVYQEADSSEAVFRLIREDWTWNALPFLLNGIGKLFADYEPPQNIKLYDCSDLGELTEQTEIADSYMEPSAITQDALITEKPKWFEVLSSSITYITAPKKRSKGQKIKINTGREMPPHLRRGHFRHLRDENGDIIKRVFVRQTVIRKDKLQTGQSLNGSLARYE